ncbi:MAG TPA: hypothetical protein VGO62_03120, partial [Myxococcota bacterium]
ANRTSTWKVVVSDADDKDALHVLVANHLPRPPSSSLTSVYPKDGGGLIPTKSEERARFMMALQGEIEHKLMTLPGIVSAHVTVAQPEKDLLHEATAASSASVAIVYNPSDDRGGKPVLTPGQKIDVEVPLLVAAAVEDLKPENVHVTWAANTASRGDIAGGASTLGSPAPAAGVTRFGIRCADGRAAQHLELFVLLSGLAVVSGLVVGAAALTRATRLRKRLATAEAKLQGIARARTASTQGVPAEV